MTAWPIPSASVEQIITRLDAALERVHTLEPSPSNLVLGFDGDGTLWDGDIGVETFEALMARGNAGLRDAALQALINDAALHGITLPKDLPSGEGRALAIARALHDAFLDGRYPDRDAYAMNAWAFAGYTEAEMDAFADEVLQKGRIDERHREALKPILEWAPAHGAEVLLVSASPKASVRRAAAKLGLGDHQILAMTPAVEAGVLQPRIQGVITYGEGKLHAIREARPGAAILAAFGDSPWDAAMLRASAIPVAVRPGAQLIAIAGSIPGLVRLKI